MYRLGVIFILTSFRFVASFGALLTIVALGISTFTQQSLKYDIIYPYTKNASMPIAQFMNGTGNAPIGNGQIEPGVDAEVLNAPYLAFYNSPGTDFTAAASCGSNNCTWDLYQTLGLRSTCQDLSSSLNMTEVYMAPYDVPLTYNTDYYTLKNGFGLTGAQPGEQSDQVSYLINSALMNVTTSWSAAIGTSYFTWEPIAFPNNGSTLMSVFVVGPSPGTVPIQPDLNFTKPMSGSLFAPPVAYECLLQFCVRNMQGKVMNGTIQETELSTWTNETAPENDRTYTYANLELHPPDSSMTFVATAFAIEGLREYLSSLLVGNATISVATDSSENWELDQYQYSSSSLMRQLYSAMNTSATGFPNMMDNLANSISLSLRSIDYQPSPVVGKAFTATSHAVVTWEWLILPFFELAGSLVFLIIVMIQTRQRGLSVPWTNSTLAYFFHGLDERPARGVVSQSEEKLAEELQVKLERDLDGGHLVIVK